MTPTQMMDSEEPAYVISVAAKMVGKHQQTLRYYERAGLIIPSRSRGNMRLYSQSDITRLRQLLRLIDDFGVNLAGAEVIIKMRERMERMEEELEDLRRQLADARLDVKRAAGAATGKKAAQN